MAQKTQRQESRQAAKRTGMDPIVLSAGISVMLSWYYFFVKGDREMGLFVGLWPPTQLAFASYFRQTRMHEMLEARSNSVVTRVQEMLQEQ